MACQALKATMLGLPLTNLQSFPLWGALLWHSTASGLRSIYPSCTLLRDYLKCLHCLQTAEMPCHTCGARSSFVACSSGGALIASEASCTGKACRQRKRLRKVPACTCIQKSWREVIFCMPTAVRRHTCQLSCYYIERQGAQKLQGCRDGSKSV